MKMPASLPVLAVSVLAVAAASQDIIAPPLPDLADGQFKQADVKKLAVAITRAAHPTGKDPALLKHSDSKKDGVVRLKMQVEYFGAASKNRYTADALLQIRLPKTADDPFEVTGIDFVDNNNTIPPNRKNLKRLMDDMNARFRIQAAK